MKTVEKVKNLFTSYSLNDVLSSLFSLNVWLPNISSGLKFHLFYRVIEDLSSLDYNKTDKILNYEDFCGFSEALIKTTPHFPTLEDFVPIMDWGQVKYKFSDKEYKIFYGSTISDIYDHYYTKFARHAAFLVAWRSLEAPDLPE